MYRQRKVKGNNDGLLRDIAVVEVLFGTGARVVRHSVATYLIEEGVDISYVQQILGHSSLRTTQLYLHIATEKQAEILRMKHPRRKMRIG